MNPQKITACLLAGGKSSRMGSDKAAVSFGGLPLWRRQLATLRAANIGSTCGVSSTR